MKTIVISSPTIFTNEAIILQKLIEKGATYIHIRKPNTDLFAVREILEKIPSVFHPKIKLHYYSELLQEFPLIGFHHSRNTHFDEKMLINQSKSFHSFKKIIANKAPYQYYFLSPIFPSISKEGYHPNYSLTECKRFLMAYPNNNCIALGGISAQKYRTTKGSRLYRRSFIGRTMARRKCRQNHRKIRKNLQTNKPLIL